LGPEHATVAVALLRLGNVHARRGQFAEAEPPVRPHSTAAV
jgi:hypothetical protein